MADLINKTDTLNQGREKLNEAIKDADKAKADAGSAVGTSNQAKQIAQTAEHKADSVQAQFDQVVIEGDSSVEAAAARVDTENVSHPTLKARLDAEYTEVTAQLVETKTKKADKQYVDDNLAVKRNKSEKITSADLDISSNANKIKPINISDELMQMFSPAGTVNPVIPNEGVTKEKVAPNAIDHSKLDFGGVKKLIENMSVSEEHPFRGKAISFQQISSSYEITFYKQIHIWGNDIVQYSLVPNPEEASKAGTKVTFTGDSWDGEKLKVTLTAHNVLVLDRLTNQAVVRTDMSKVVKTDIILARVHYGILRGGALSDLMYDLPQARGFEDQIHSTFRADEKLEVIKNGSALEIKINNFYIKRGTIEVHFGKSSTPINLRTGVGTYNSETGEYTFTLADNDVLLYNSALHLIYKMNHTSNTMEQYGSHVWLLARNNLGNLTGGMLREIYNNRNIDKLNKKIDNLEPSETASTGVYSTLGNMVAHRGLSRIAPENTLPAYEKAGEYGMWGGECDIRRTSDGKFILMHDATVDRTTNGTGNVHSHPLVQIKGLTVDAGYNIDKYPNLRVPTMEEYLNVCKRVGIVPVIHLYIDTAHIGDFLEEIKRLGFESNCLVLTFDRAQVVALRQMSKLIPIQLLSTTFTTDDVDWCVENECDIDVSNDAVTRGMVEYAHSQGLQVGCYNTNVYEEADNLLSMGVDYVSTDLLINSSKLKSSGIITRMTESDFTTGAHPSLTKVSKTEGLLDGEWTHMSNGVVRVKEGTTQRGVFTKTITDVHPDDVIEIEAYFRLISGNPPRLRLDYDNNGTATFIGNAIAKGTGDWERVVFRCVAEKVTSNFTVNINYLNSLASEFEVRDVKIRHIQY